MSDKANNILSKTTCYYGLFNYLYSSAYLTFRLSAVVVVE